MKEKKRIMVGLSGGVDSSVAALLLQNQGYDVIGVFIKVWQADFLPCNWREERRDAMRVAAKLGIPFLTLDLEKEYRETVVRYLIEEYGKGRVPNPDVMCNKEVKFGSFLSFAHLHKADAIATGHYARVKESPNGTYQLLEGCDKEKDQSYFLWTLTQPQLAHAVFPLGEYKKDDTRKLAKKFDLPTSGKKDSQGICFLGKVDIKEFLRHFLALTPGKVLSENGKEIGEHDGALLFTIGQRHGFHVTTTLSSAAPLYVVSKNMEKNTITVSPKSESPVHSSSVCKIASVSFCSDESQKRAHGKNIFAQIRYHGDKYPVKKISAEGDVREIIFDSSVPEITPGQSLVLFHEDQTLLGGGIIE